MNLPNSVFYSIYIDIREMAETKEGQEQLAGEHMANEIAEEAGA